MVTVANGHTIADFVLRRAGELVTMSASDGLGVVEHGALAASGDRIVWVGAEVELDEATDGSGRPVRIADDAVVVDAEGAVVLPGFVDSHTHAVFAGSRADEYSARLEGVSYAEILASGGGINRTVAATRAATAEELAAATRRRLDSFLAHGTTTLEIKSGYGLTLADERKMLAAAAVEHPTRRVRTFLGAHFVPPEYEGRADDFIAAVCNEMLPALAGEAEFCDVFCDEGAFTVEQSRRVLTTARGLGYGLKIHADELARSGGSRLAAELGCVSADHLVHAARDDISALHEAGVVATMLPGTSFTLGAPYAPGPAFLEAGVTVALATDFNPGTCYCENLQIAIALACQGMRLAPDQALFAATMGGAAALALQNDVGSLQPGKACDLIVLAAESRRELPYHFGVNLVDGVVVGGTVVVRNGLPTAAAAAPAPVASGDGS
jgi:imidazolonepropionase